MTTRNGKMFSIIITVIYIRCMLCATTDISSTGTIDTIKYSTLEMTPYVTNNANSSQQATSNIETTNTSDDVTDTTRVLTTDSPLETTSTSDSINTSQQEPHNTMTTVSPFTTTETSTQTNTTSTKPSQDTTATIVVNTTSHSTTTVQSRTTKTDKLHGMTLEEKQKRNGLASAIICVGSLILIVIAYFSSFIDKPIEKVPKIDRKELQNSKYTFDNEGQIPNVKEETGKKISFGEVSQFSMKQSPDTTNDIQMTNFKEIMTDEHSENRKGTTTEGRPGLDVFTQNR